ncbi:MAG: polyphosphate kinase 1 [Verrucomicrobiae bacterium]|nr:polyphosphate kinase 1 [Verrucomicrobiae bacterium]
MKIPFRSKETSWLAFNARVLQEGTNPEVPLLERIKFLGIYSSNMDEFFRVRVATLKRLTMLGTRWRELNIPDPNETLREVNAMVADQARDFNVAYDRALADLSANGIELVNDNHVPAKLQGWLTDYFRNEVSPHLMPIMLKATAALPQLKDHPMYLAIRLSKKRGNGRPAHAFLEIPGDLPRFVVLPEVGKKRLVMYLDDIIRFGLGDLFGHLPYDHYESYAIKFTRDAEIQYDDDFTESFYEKLTEGLKAREEGLPVRANYDAAFPKNFLNLVLRKLSLAKSDTLYPGARYHNRKDLISFPKLGRDDLLYPKSPPVFNRALKRREKLGFFNILRKQDVLLHFPYHFFRRYIELLREASIDPLVQEIWMTQYRLAKRSFVAKALMAAAQNGKKVTVLVEPTARFDEKANIAWANAYRAAGVRVVLGVPGLKVHSKLLLIHRREHGTDRYYSALGTGNFNEDTASIFADHLLLTSHTEIGQDVAAIFKFFEHTYRRPRLKHLKIAPFDLRNFLREKIEREIAIAKRGGEGRLSLKINNISDVETVELLYQAAQAGVKIRMICRSMFSVLTDAEGPGAGIEAIGIVDRYLEHSRLLIFHNEGNPEMYLSSADFLPRNFDTRVETIFPVLEPKLAEQLLEYFEIQWRDNCKARILDKDLQNRFRKRGKNEEKVRSQYEIEKYLRSLS